LGEARSFAGSVNNRRGIFCDRPNPLPRLLYMDVRMSRAQDAQERHTQEGHAQERLPLFKGKVREGYDLSVEICFGRNMFRKL
jgi:hypothetical protein